MVDNLKNEDIPHKIHLNDQNNITHLFFAFPDAIKMTIISNTLLLVYATYKTNKYRMPLVHAIGVSSKYQTPSRFFCFMKSETESDYNWTFQTARRLFGEFKIDVIMADNDLALMNAIKTNFPEAKIFSVIGTSGRI